MMREGKVFTTSLPTLWPDSAALMRGHAGTAASDVPVPRASPAGCRAPTRPSSLLVKRAGRGAPRTGSCAPWTRWPPRAGRACWCRLRRADAPEAGASIEEVRDWVEEHKLNLAHWFTVDDLMFLFRGGRVSRTSAWAGTLLNIKPILHVDDEGHLIPMEKLRGRKKAIKGLLDHMERTATKPVSEQTVFITHGDCIEDAECARPT